MTDENQNAPVRADDTAPISWKRFALANPQLAQQLVILAVMLVIALALIAAYALGHGKIAALPAAFIGAVFGSLSTALYAIGRQSDGK